MKTYPSGQPLGFSDVGLRVLWLETKGNPLSRLAQWVEFGLINLIYRATAGARYEPRHRTSGWPAA